VQGNGGQFWLFAEMLYESEVNLTPDESTVEILSTFARHFGLSCMHSLLPGMTAAFDRRTKKNLARAETIR
jgi:hypothetical protein